MPAPKRTTRRLVALVVAITCNIGLFLVLHSQTAVELDANEPDTAERHLTKSVQLPAQAVFKTAAVVPVKTEPTQIEVNSPPEPITRPPGQAINCLYLHVPKTGGTSLVNQFKTIQHSSPRVHQRRMFTFTAVPHMKHFDWSVVEQWKAKHDYQIVTLLRDPVDRAISHFHFIKSQPWVSPDFRQMNLEQFVRSPKALMETRGVWQDGQVVVG